MKTYSLSLNSLFLNLILLDCKVQLFGAAEHIPKEYTIHTFADVSGKPKVTFSNKGDGTFTGTLISETGTSSLDTLQVKKDLNVKGDLSARKVSVTGSIDALSIDLKMKLTATKIESSGDVTSNELLSKSLRVNGIANVTGDVSINGQTTVGSLITRGNIEARYISSVGMKSPTIESTGIVKGKDVEVQNILKVIGTIHASDASFQGDVTITKQLRAQEVDMKVALVSDKLEVKNAIKCTGIISSNNLETKGDVNMTGAVNIRILTTRDIRVEDTAKIRHLSAEIVAAKEIQSFGSIGTNNINVTEDTRSKNLYISNHTFLNKIEAKAAKVSDMIIEGKLIANGLLIANSDYIVNANLAARAVTAETSINSKNIHVSDMISANNIIAEGSIEAKKMLISERVEIRDSVITKDIEALTANVTKIESNFFTSDSIQTINLLTQSLNISNHMRLNGNALMKENLQVIGGIDASNATITGDLNVGGTIRAEDFHVANKVSSTNIQVSDELTSARMKVMEILETESAIIKGSIHVQKESNLGSLLVNQGSVHIPATLTVDESTIFRKQISVNGSIAADYLNISNEILALSIRIGTGDVVIENGLITSSNGFVSKSGALECNTVNASGMITAQNGLFTPNVTVLNILTSPSITSLSIASKSIAADRIYFNYSDSLESHTNNLIVHGATLLKGNVTLDSNVKVNGTVSASEVQIENGLKAKSVFTSRIYSQDVFSNGYITADAIINKGDMKVHGTAEIETLSVASKITSSFVNVTDALTCTTASVFGVMDAAGIVTRKATINGELFVKGINIYETLDELNTLKSRVDLLEDLVRKLQQSR